MTRILLVAKTEFLAIVKTKGFIIGLLTVPLLIMVGAALGRVRNPDGDLSDHRVAILDRTSVLFDALKTAADEHNTKAGRGTEQTGPYFVLERAGGAEADGATAMALSQRVRDKDLFAFVDIPANVLDPAGNEAGQISYYTQSPSYTPLPQWIGTTLERAIMTKRFETVAIDPAKAVSLTRPTRVNTLDLFERRPDGTIVAARRVSQLQTVAVPLAMMYLLFMAVMTSAPQLLTAVIEEKMSRVSEVLIASIPPLHLMSGKLLGVAGVSVALASIYLGGGIYALFTSGNFDLVRPALIGWAFIFLVCAVLIFGSVFIAIGSACSDLKDSQAMMQPVMLFLALPVLMSTFVLRAPNSPLAVGLSLFPPSTPFLMLVRLALTPAPPMWQVLLSLVLTISTAALFVWAAGKIFRVGLLMQGKPPNLPELLRWIRQ
ncbi:MAG: ABC transporter permease [Acidobacteriota bacterium]